MSLIDQLIEELKNNPQKLEEFFTLFKDKFISLALGEINRKIDILLRDREEIFKRFEEHDKKFEEVIKRLEEHDKKFEEVIKRLEEHDKKFEEIVKRLEEHDRKFVEIMKKLEEHDRKFVEIMNRLEEHDKKFVEIMERLEEHDKKFVEITKKLEEHDKKFVEITKKLEEHDRKFEEIVKRLEEHDKKFVEVMNRLEDHDKKFVEITKKLEEHDKKFEEIMKRLEEHDKKFIQVMEEIKAIRLEMRRMNKRIGTLEINLGFLTESFAIDFFTRYLNEKVISITRHYQIDNKEIDAMIETENKYFLLEVKSRVSPQDVVQMYSLVSKFIKEAKKEVRPTILGVRVKNEAIEVGKKLGIDVIRI